MTRRQGSRPPRSPGWPGWPSWPNRRDRRLARRLAAVARPEDREPPAGLLRRLADDIPDRWPVPGATLPPEAAPDRRSGAPGGAARTRWMVAASLAAAIAAGALGLRVLEQTLGQPESRGFHAPAAGPVPAVIAAAAAGKPGGSPHAGSVRRAAAPPAPAAATPAEADRRDLAGLPPAVARKQAAPLQPPPAELEAKHAALAPAPAAKATSVPPPPVAAAPPAVLGRVAPPARDQGAGAGSAGIPTQAQAPRAASQAPPPLVAPLPRAAPAAAEKENRINVGGNESGAAGLYTPAAPAGASEVDTAAQLQHVGGNLAGAPPRQASALRVGMPDGSLRSSFGDESGTAAYRRLRRELLDAGRLPHVGTSQLEELVNAFQPRAKLASSPGLSAEGAPLPERAGAYLLRFAGHGLAVPPGQGAVVVEFEPALVARARRLGATADNGSAAALYEIDLRRDQVKQAVGADTAADPAVATLTVRAGAAAGDGAGQVRVVRLSDLRPSLAVASPALRVQGLAARFGEALAAPAGVSPERLQQLRAEAQALAAELTADPRAGELRDLIARAAEIAAPPRP